MDDAATDGLVRSLQAGEGPPSCPSATGETTRTEGAKPDTPQPRPSAPPPPSQPSREVRPAAPARRAPVLMSGRRHPDHIGASGRLVVADQQTALRAVADLLTSLGGVEIARRTDATSPAEVLIEGRLPREAYPAFVEGLARMGTWSPDAVPRSSEESLLVAVRIVR